MTNRFGVELHPKDIRWAAAEGVSQDVIAAVLLLHERSVDEIAPQLTAVELEQVIVLVGRSPRVYARGTLEALESKRARSRPPPAEAPSNGAHPDRRGASTDAGVGDPRGRLARPFSSIALGRQQSPPERQNGGEASHSPPNPEPMARLVDITSCGPVYHRAFPVPRNAEMFL
jgi:hypothetical protein